MATALQEVKAALRDLIEITEDPDVGGQDISYMPVNVLAGALIFISNDLKKYTPDEIVQILLLNWTPRSIPWTSRTEWGYQHSEIESMAQEL